MREINIRELKENAVGLIADEWMLVGAGNEGGFNMMTASWGGLGEMWNKDVAVTVVRPQRYTYQFLEQNDLFSLSFFGDDKAVHAVCGSKSGRDINKAAATGLTPCFEHGTVTFEQARLTLICRKIYVSDVKPECFIDRSLLNCYKDNDYHRAYVGEIIKVLVKE
jgi:flavin reductase (DIM6/NTAB) family NADH-FMN oxidoreductase RutF